MLILCKIDAFYSINFTARGLIAKIILSNVYAISQSVFIEKKCTKNVDKIILTLNRLVADSIDSFKKNENQFIKI